MRFAPLLLLLLWVPTVQATDSLYVQVDADEFVFQVAEPESGSQAAGIREEIDEEYGNGDGTVQADEVIAYQNDSRVTFSNDQRDCFDSFDFVRIDGRPPVRLAEVREEIIGATNTPVTSTAPLQEVTVIHFRFERPSSAAPTVTVQLSAASDFGSAIPCATGASDGVPGTGYPRPGPPWGTGGADVSPLPSAGVSDAGQEEAPETIYRIHPLGEAKIDPDTIRPTSLRPLWDSKGLRADTESEERLLAGNRVTFTVNGGAAGGDPTFAGTARDVGAIIGYTTVGVGAVAGVAALSAEFARYKMLKWLILVPGFTRLEKDEVLEHSKRDELYRFIKTNPGPSFSDLRRELAVSNGTLVHHLRILEAQEYVKAVRDGFRTRFYVRGPKIVPTSYLTRTQQQLLEAIATNPGLTQKELSLVLGLPRESVSYHTKQLASKGRLQIKQDGKWRRYWPTQTGSGLPSAAPAPAPSATGYP